MKRAELTRPEFLEWLSNPGGAPRSTRRQSSKGDVTLIWLDGEEGSFPIIAVPATELREFLAFTATYVASYVPFTAFFRVTASELVAAIDRRTTVVSEQIKRGLIGTTIADAVFQLRPQERKLQDVTLQSCLATPSAVALAGSALGYETTLAMAAIERWHIVRNQLNLTSTASPEPQLRRFWNNLLSSVTRGDAPDVDYRITDFVESVLAGRGVATTDGWRSLTRSMPELHGTDEKLRGTREQRVRTLEALRDDLRRSSLTTAFQEMIVGYAAAQVAEGSFAYLSLAARSSDGLPYAQLWFGFFAALHIGSDVLTAGDCLGRHIGRHFAEYGSKLPSLTSDISYEEFLLVNDETRSRALRTKLQGIVEVELLPGVAGRFRTVRNERSPVEERYSTALDHARRLVSELEYVLRGASNPPSASTDDLFLDGTPQQQPRKSRSKRTSP